MDENAAKGGSYIRQADGSLKLVNRTEPAKPLAPAEAKTVAAPKTSAGKKEQADG